MSITSVQKIEGDATVSMIRGKKKYLYDLNTTVRWKVSDFLLQTLSEMFIDSKSEGVGFTPY